MVQDKIVISLASAKLLVDTLSTRKEQLEEELLLLVIELEDIQNAIKTPLEVLDKKDGTDFALTKKRVKDTVEKCPNHTIAELAQILIIELNLKNDKEMQKKVGQRIYAHMWVLLKKDKEVEEEEVREKGAKVYRIAGTKPYSNVKTFHGMAVA